MVSIYTIQISVAKKLNLAEDERYLDVTVKSGDKTFVPTWKMVMGHKQRRITNEEYLDEYYEMMRDSYQNNRQRWDEILSMEEIILACYCRTDSFCHRYLLKDMLVECGAEYVREIRSLDDIKGEV
jgi:uncharacterized protein YeaO (DUF488 family)